MSNNNYNIDAKVTITFSMKNLIDQEALQEAYNGDLTECVKSTIEDEGLFGVLELDSVEIVNVEQAVMVSGLEEAKFVRSAILEKAEGILKQE